MYYLYQRTKDNQKEQLLHSRVGLLPVSARKKEINFSMAGLEFLPISAMKSIQGEQLPHGRLELLYYLYLQGRVIRESSFSMAGLGPSTNVCLQAPHWTIFFSSCQRKLKCWLKGTVRKDYICPTTV
jgi:hypothetical protein